MKTLAFLPIVFLAACSGASSQDPGGAGADRSGIVKIAVDAGSPAPTCSGGGFGNANGACSTDESFFNSAVADCKESHQVLAAFKADEHCGAGSSSSATYSCCAKAQDTGGGGFGNANGVCDPDSAMFTTAEEGCTGEGMDITGFVPSESCGKGSSSSATYTCSPGAGKPPPPPVDAGGPACPTFVPPAGGACNSAVNDQVCSYGKCPAGEEGAPYQFACKQNVWESVGNGTCAPTCSSGGFGNANGVCSTDESFFNSAVANCAENKQVLSAFLADEHCGAGSSSSATYSCCSTAPGGGSGGGFGNANGVCDPDTSMFTTAEQSCRSDGQDIIAFVPSESCGKGSSDSATYTCAP
jgi:hypothetical protein